MVYKDKARDMKRAPLPSRADKKARDKKRRARKDSRRHGKNMSRTAMNHGWNEALDRFDPNWDNQHGPGWDRATRDVVRERRYADNLGALMRWAEDLAKKNPNCPPDELRLKVREIIGWDYMADHLMSHVEDIEAYQINPTRYGWRQRIGRSNNYEWSNDYLIPKMVEICEDLWLRGENRKLKGMSRKFPSNKALPGWTEVKYNEKIYKTVYEREGVEPQMRFGRYKQVWTGEYRVRSVWYRKILSYAEITDVVTQWVGANRSAVHDFIKHYE